MHPFQTDHADKIDLKNGSAFTLESFESCLNYLNKKVRHTSCKFLRNLQSKFKTNLARLVLWYISDYIHHNPKPLLSV
jgi:hypothetical protein